jgi:hypothetical protein
MLRSCLSYLELRGIMEKAHGRPALSILGHHGGLFG